jgi:hypothetical protein
MILCILNSNTKVVENRIVIDSIESFVPYKEDIEVAPQHDGNIGWIWNGTGWDIPDSELTYEELCEKVREERNNRLVLEVDKLNSPRWESFTEEQQQQWRTYRQELLDITEQEGFPENVIWPETPLD